MGEKPNPTPPDKNAEWPQNTQPGPVLSKEDTLRKFFLGRLEYLTALRDGLPPLTLNPNRDENMVNKAMYSTYRDCVALGIADKAMDIINPSSDTEEPLPQTGIIFHRSDKK